MDQLPRFGKRDLICLLLFTCNYVVSVWRSFLFLWVLLGYVILLWHSLSLPYNYFVVVFRLHYINTLKHELKGTKAHKETSTDEVTVVNSHLNALPLKFS